MKPRKAKKAFNEFRDTRIYTSPVITEKQNDVYDEFVNVLVLGREIAFEVGFLAAMQLLEDCGLNTDKITAQT